MPEELIGTVTHYFPRPQVGVVRLTASIAVGDTLHFQGRSADFQQRVTSMEIEHARVETASAGAEIAIKVDQQVREGDKVYRVTS